MKRCVIIVAVIVGSLWNAGFASAQHRMQTTRSHTTTMSGRIPTISGNTTNHNHITPQRVGVPPNPYTAGVIPAGGRSPYTAGAVILPNGNGGFPFGTTIYPGGNYYNPATWSGPPYSSFSSGFNSLSGWRGR
jgi:hypothetical protein